MIRERRKPFPFIAFILFLLTIILATANLALNLDFSNFALIGILYIVVIICWIETRRQDITFSFGMIAFGITAIQILSYLK